MINTYRFELNRINKEAEYIVNKHKVNSGVFTMLYSKIMEHPKYRRDYTSTHTFEKDGFVRRDIANVYVLVAEQ